MGTKPKKIMDPSGNNEPNRYNLLRCCCILLLVFIVEVTWSQVAYQATYGGSVEDFGLNAILTSDGGYVLVSSSENTGPSDFDISVIKTDKYGATEWSKTYGGGQYEEGYGIQQLSDSGYIVLGTTTSYGAGNIDCYLIRTDAIGDTVWTKTIGGPAADWPLALEVTAQDEVVFTGFATDPVSGYSHMYLVKVDANGNLLWTKMFGFGDSEYAYGLTTTPDDGFILVGYTNRTTQSPFCLTGFCQSAFLIKTDMNGDTVWTKVYGSIGGDVGYAIDTVSSGGYIFTGSTRDTSTNILDLILVRITEDGDITWSKQYAGSGTEIGYSVKETTDGGFIVAGITNTAFPGAISYAYLLKTDANGVEEWSKAYGGSGDDGIYNVKQTADGGYLLSGATTSFGPGDYDIYIIKTDSTGYSGGCSEYIPTVVESNLVMEINRGANVTSFGTIQSAGNEGVVKPATDKNLCLEASTLELGVALEISLYPNPGTGQITIKINGDAFNEIVKLSIYNSIGKLVYMEDLSLQPLHEMDLGFLGSGLFYVEFEGKNLARITEKLIVLND